MSAFDLREHDLIDVERLVDDAHLLPRLLFVPFGEVGKHILINIVGPVIDLEDMASVLCTGAEHCRYCDDG